MTVGRALAASPRMPKLLAMVLNDIDPHPSMVNRVSFALLPYSCEGILPDSIPMLPLLFSLYVSKLLF